MKKIIFTAALLLSVTMSYGQLDLGIKGGYTSTLGLNDYGSLSSGSYNLNSLRADMGTNFHVGAFGRLFFGKLYIQPELLYSFTRSNYTITLQDAANNSITFDKIAKTKTIDVPLLLGFKVLDLKLANLRVFAGPKARFNAGSTLDLKNLSGVSATALQKDIKQSQIGLEAGLGVDVLMFALDFRYHLMDDINQTSVNTQSLKAAPTNTFVISLGWKIL